MNRVTNVQQISSINTALDNLWIQSYEYETYTENLIYSDRNKGTFPCIKIDNEEQFDYLQNQLERQNRLQPNFQMLYRGQKDIHWLLLSTLEREIHKLTKKDITVELYKQAYERIYQDLIYSQMLHFPKTDNLHQDMVNAFAVGQHYGLFTPLLDWTKSFDIALFFAFQDECENGYRAVYRIFSDFTRFGGEENKIVEPTSDLFGRIGRQQGVFSWWGAESIFRQSLEKLEERYQQEGEKYTLTAEQAKAKMMTKYYISDELSCYIREDLKNKGICKDYLFPDFEKSISNSINKNFREWISTEHI